MFRERFCIYMSLTAGSIPPEEPKPEGASEKPDAAKPPVELLDNQKKEVTADTKKDLIAGQASGALENLKSKFEAYDKDLPTPDVAFNPVTSLDNWQVNMAVSQGKINPDVWSPVTPVDRSKLSNDWNAVGLPVTSPYFVSIFNQYKKCSDVDFLNKLQSEEQKSWYRDPSTYIEKIRSSGDKAFCSAWDTLKAFRDQAKGAAISAYKGAGDLVAENREPVLDGVTNFAKQSYRDFGRAVKERDYGTMAAYGIAAYAIYRGLKWLWGKKEGGWAKSLQTGIIGLGIAYSAAYIGKRNGHPGLYNFLTLKSATDSTAKDNPRLKPLLKLVPQANKSQAEGGLNETMFMRASAGKMARLQELYTNSNSEFIDPKEFGNVFKEFNGATRGDLERSHDTNYLNTGKQLYLIAKYINVAYTKTLYQDDKKKDKYYGVSLSEVLSKPPHKYSDVGTFVETLKPYAK